MPAARPAALQEKPDQTENAWFTKVFFNPFISQFKSDISPSFADTKCES